MDLKSAGFSIMGSITNARSIIPPDDSAQNILMRDARRTQIHQASPLIACIERNGIPEYLADGRSIDVSRIRPELAICVSKADHKIFAYAKLFQQVPSTNRVGRQMRALIYDVGQQRPFLAGIIELASSPYTLGCRDSVFEWNGAERKVMKDSGLRNTMDLATVMALPPYNILFGGKLAAALALSNPVRDEFKRRYGGILLALITTSANGLHCPILNRIGIVAGGIYRRIGETSGYTTSFVSARTLCVARKFLPDYRSSPWGEFSVSVRPIHILRHAMKICGVPAETILRSACPKGVYLGSLSPHHIAALRKGKHQVAGCDLPVDAIADYWRRHLLAKALSNDARRAKFDAYVRCSPGASANKGAV